ncbi:hypothetical protein D3C85_1358110 [compost metagenome]
MVTHFHVEAGRPSGNGFADTTQPQNAQALARHLGRYRKLPQRAPLSRFHVTVADGGSARGGKQQGPRQVGHAIIQHVRCDADADAACGGGP